MSWGPWEIALVALIAILIFGGSRLAGIGKSAGRAIREFKEETSTPAKPIEPPAAAPAEPAKTEAPETEQQS